MVGDIIALTIGEIILNAVLWFAEGSPGYSYTHDWQNKRRLSLFKHTARRRQTIKGHNREGRQSLQSLGLRVINL